MPQLYDEHKELGTFWSWVIIIIYGVSLVTFSYWLLMFVRDQTRQWDFGELPDAPAEHIYTTPLPPRGKASPQQVAPLPEATAPAPREPETELPEERQEG